jgi:hypothetical protein
MTPTSCDLFGSRRPSSNASLLPIDYGVPLLFVGAQGFTPIREKNISFTIVFPTNRVAEHHIFS